MASPSSAVEVGDDAVFVLSSAKPGNGVEQLRDNNTDSFWQSDGTSPHSLSISFHQKMRLTALHFYTDFKLDESYTPAKVSVRAGTCAADAVEVNLVDLDEPVGWVVIPLAPNADPATNADAAVRASFVQMCILASQQNGRDTHVRQVKIFGFRAGARQPFGTAPEHFSSVEFQSMAQLR